MKNRIRLAIDEKRAAKIFKSLDIGETTFLTNVVSIDSLKNCLTDVAYPGIYDVKEVEYRKVKITRIK